MSQDLYPACETRIGKNPLPPVITAAQPDQRLLVTGNVFTLEESSTCAFFAHVGLHSQEFHYRSVTSKRNT